MMTDPSEPRPDEDAVEAYRGRTRPRALANACAKPACGRGYDLTQVARDLRLTPERVKAIENEDYPRLPDAVFVVGYVEVLCPSAGPGPGGR